MPGRPRRNSVAQYAPHSPSQINGAGLPRGEIFDYAPTLAIGSGRTPSRRPKPKFQTVKSLAQAGLGRPETQPSAGLEGCRQVGALKRLRDL